MSVPKIYIYNKNLKSKYKIKLGSKLNVKLKL